MREQEKSPEGALHEVCGADFILTIGFEYIRIGIQVYLPFRGFGPTEYHERLHG